jgi:hypothetical protein
MKFIRDCSFYFLEIELAFMIFIKLNFFGNNTGVLNSESFLLFLASVKAKISPVHPTIIPENVI